MYYRSAMSVQTFSWGITIRRYPYLLPSGKWEDFTDVLISADVCFWVLCVKILIVGFFRRSCLLNLRDIFWLQCKGHDLFYDSILSWSRIYEDPLLALVGSFPPSLEWRHVLSHMLLTSLNVCLCVPIRLGVPIGLWDLALLAEVRQAFGEVRLRQFGQV